jgi:hypothetical protein
MTHFPRQRKGCYYGRMDTCCWLCWWRMAWAWMWVVRQERGEGNAMEEIREQAPPPPAQGTNTGIALKDAAKRGQRRG